MTGKDSTERHLIERDVVERHSTREDPAQGSSHGSRSRQGASVIDAFGFVRLGKETSGSVPLARLMRAVQGLPRQPDGDAGLVRWSVRGVKGRHGEPLLRLHISARPVLVCQRCMEPFGCPIDATVDLHLVKSEAEIGNDDPAPDVSDDAESWDAQPEKVVGSHRFDVLAQVEDELILNIPYVPRHEQCPGQPVQTGDSQAGDAGVQKRPSPFAALEKLKQKD